VVATFSRIAADAAVGEVARYYDQVELEADIARAASYYQGEGAVTVAPGLAAGWQELLNIHPGEAPDRAGMLRFLSAESATGTPTLPRQAKYLAYDLTFSASKEVSVQWAAEPNAARRAIYEAAHRGAVRDTMEEVSRRLGWTRRGAGSTEEVRGEIAWLACQHYTARPEASGTAADPNLHTHVLIRNAVLTADEHIGAIDSMRLNGSVKEFGALYHMRMATRLADAGIAVDLDRKGIAAAVAGTPAKAVELFSKRGEQLAAAAMAFAEQLGLDWNSLPLARRTALEREAAGISRAGKNDGKIGFEGWREDLAAAGIEITDPIGQAPAPDRSPEARAVRAAQAWEPAARSIGEAFEKEAVLDETVLRTHAARALIPLGGGTLDDVDAVIEQVERRGVIVHGETTQLIRGQENSRLRYTTQAQLDAEAGIVEMGRAAAADRAGALTRDELDAVIAKTLTAKGRELNPGQLDMAVALSTRGRLALGIGVAGAGKTTLLEPVVAAFQNSARPGGACEVYGIATAWRQAGALRGAGIADAEPPGSLELAEAALSRPAAKGKRSRRQDRAEDLAAARVLRDQGIAGQRVFATAALLANFEAGKLPINSRSVVVIDEVSQLGVRDAFRLLDMQAATGCRILAIGDDKQCQAVEAGDVIDLLRRAMPDQVPELLETVRQLTNEQKEIARLFREGKPEAVEKALRMKAADGALQIVPGGTDAVHQAAGRIWTRMADEAAEKGWKFGLSAPTHQHARAVSAVIRGIRRERGEITGPDRTVACVDGRGARGEQYDLQLAVGDRVRLFGKTGAQPLDAQGRRCRGQPVRVGVNGDVAQIAGFTGQGFTVEKGGQRLEVTWQSLRDKDTGRVKLSAGEVHTIDASQGATGHLWCNLMPDGAAIGMRRGYVSESRQRVRTYTVVGEDAERQAIARERGFGSRAEVTADDVLEHMAKALARVTEKTSALRFSETIAALRGPALEMAAGEKRRAHLEHARQIDQAAVWERQRRAQPAHATVSRFAERVRVRAFERAAGPSLHQLAARVAETAAAMRAAYGRLLDATRLREGPEVVAAHLQVAVRRIRPGMKVGPARSRPAQRGPAPAR